jgi:hypothetical protein
VLLIVLSVFGFFGYQIYTAAGTKESMYSSDKDVEEAIHRDMTEVLAAKTENYEDAGGAPINHRVPPHAIPRIAGQTEEDLRTPNELQQAPPTSMYLEPEPVDVLNSSNNNVALFGSNLRHPEQMIERHPGVRLGNVVEAGLGSERSYNGSHDATGYAPEMIQNGGEWMKGVSAFDVSDNGTGFSMV